MSTEANKALFLRLNEEVMHQGNLAVVDELFTAAAVVHVPGAPDFLGRDGARQLFLAYRTAFPDVHITAEDLFAVDDRVVERYTFAGTHRGELQGIAPTGKAVRVPGMGVARIVGGQMAEVWFLWDTLGLLQQLGVVPAT